MDIIFDKSKQSYSFGAHFETWRNGRSMDQFEYDTVESLSDIGLVYCKRTWHYTDMGLFLIIDAHSVSIESELDTLLNKGKVYVQRC